jgi:hypothetical protein
MNVHHRGSHHDVPILTISMGRNADHRRNLGTPKRIGPCNQGRLNLLLAHQLSVNKRLKQPVRAYANPQHQRRRLSGVLNHHRNPFSGIPRRRFAQRNKTWLCHRTKKILTTTMILKMTRRHVLFHQLYGRVRH